MGTQPRVLVEHGPVHRRVNFVLAGMIGVAIGGSLAFGAVLRLIHDGSVRNCRQIEVVKHGLRQTMGEAERFSSSSPVRSVAEREATAKFYRDALGRLRPRSC